MNNFIPKVIDPNKALSEELSVRTPHKDKKDFPFIFSDKQLHTKRMEILNHEHRNDADLTYRDIIFKLTF